MSLCVVFNMDCVTGLLDRIDDNYFDAVITDPPYGLSGSLPKPEEVKHKSDFGNKQIYTSKGEWDSFKTKEGLENFTRKWLDSSFRKLRKGGHLFTFGTHHNIFLTKRLLEEVGFTFRQMLIWYAPNSPPCPTNLIFAHNCEYILWATKGSNYTFNNTKERGINITKQIKDIFIMNSLSSTDPERVEGHPTQKPIELMEQLIKVSTNEGDLVLEPFLGSGTTMTACTRTNRHCFGFEVNPDYIPIIKKKVNWGQKPHDFFLFTDDKPQIDKHKIDKYMKQYKGILSETDIIDMINKGNLQ